jgi:hypothetical protein
MAEIRKAIVRAFLVILAILIVIVLLLSRTSTLTTTERATIVQEMLATPTPES